MAIRSEYSKEDEGNVILWRTVDSVSKRIWVPGAVIVGAGPSGVAVAACLKQQGVPFLVLEKASCIGSLWKFKTYNCLQLHLPKKFCELPYLPFPSEFPSYPTKLQFLRYLETYAEQFSIRPMFGQEVRSVAYDETVGFWKVEANESEFICRWLIVASGENAEPVLPNIPGISEYSGLVIHSSKYKDGADFQGQKVLVVGCGNSGMEVGLDLCKNGAQVSMVVRDKVHILPREVLGRSTFGISMWLLNWFSVKTVDRLLLLYSRVVLGDTHRSGIERPEAGPLERKNSAGKTPVLDIGAFSKIKSGEIKVACGMQRFTFNGVQFIDGRTEEYDAVILATGYKSNVTSWLKEDTFFNPNDGYPNNPFPDNWKGKNGLYSVGFTRRGLLGASIDAQMVARDIAVQWMSETRHVRT